jgi:hypothetical protein
MRRLGFIVCLLALSDCTTSAFAATNNKPQPAPRAAPRQMVRPPTMQQPRAGIPGQRPMQGGVGQRQMQGGMPGAGRTSAGSAGVGPAASPRSQLYDMVRPAPMMARPAPGAAPRMAGMPASGPVRAIPKPANVNHIPGHVLGNAGSQHNHSAFVFRRGDRAFHRRYYAVGGAWYWYDDPVAETDPAFAAAQDPNVQVCEEQADECF